MLVERTEDNDMEAEFRAKTINFLLRERDCCCCGLAFVPKFGASTKISFKEL